MWARALRLVGIVLASVFLGYLIGSNQGLGILTSSPQASPFVVSGLSIQPEVIRPNETVTITVSVTNTHNTWGIYSLVLQIDGVREVEGQATVDAGGTEHVSFTVQREKPGRYKVFVNGLRGSFKVAAPTY